MRARRYSEKLAALVKGSIKVARMRRATLTQGTIYKGSDITFGPKIPIILNIAVDIEVIEGVGIRIRKRLVIMKSVEVNKTTRNQLVTTMICKRGSRSLC